MKQIPTVFKRNDKGLVTNEIVPGCEWVFDPTVVAIPRRKYDGLCMLKDGEQWYYRRQVKPHRPTPDTFVQVDFDEATQYKYGWVSIEDSFSYYKHWRIALEYGPLESDYRGVELGWDSTTYELVGPRIAGGKDKTIAHRLVKHTSAEIISNIPNAEESSFEGLKHVFSYIDVEGVVWYDRANPDRRAKLKKKDFGFDW